MRLVTWLGAIVLLWAGVCAWYYLRQESMAFFPSKLPASHEFEFDRHFEAHRIEVAPGISLSALLFLSESSAAERRRAVLYLHGNAGDLQSWGTHADLYLDQGYDFLAIDYRGYGLSDGSIGSEAELHADVQAVWDWLTTRYAPGSITVVGYSLGSTLGARVACANGARRLVLIAPFYSGKDIARRVAPWLPSVLVRYAFRTDEVLAGCSLPVTLFHGEDDRTIPPEASERLLELTGGRGSLHLLPGTGHSDVAENAEFQRRMMQLLNPTAP